MEISSGCLKRATVNRWSKDLTVLNGVEKRVNWAEWRSYSVEKRDSSVEQGSINLVEKRANAAEKSTSNLVEKRSI